MSKLRLLTRADLPPGAQASQLVHATAQFFYEHNERARKWYEESNTVVLLSAADEPALHQVLLALPYARISRVREPDLGDALTALALDPYIPRRHTAKFPLALR
jgi:hypothetical protein